MLALVAAAARSRVNSLSASSVSEPRRSHAELARGARALALRLHRLLEARLVDGEPALARDVGRQVHREAVGVVELEDRVARRSSCP